MQDYDRKAVQKLLQDIKAEYLHARGREGLGRKDWDPSKEIEETEFLDMELMNVFAVRARAELAAAMGITAWLKPEGEFD